MALSSHFREQGQNRVIMSLITTSSLKDLIEQRYATTSFSIFDNVLIAILHLVRRPCDI